MASSNDPQATEVDSVLLFQFSRAQNLIHHWKFKMAVTAIAQAGTNQLVVVNKLNEIQSIYNESVEKLAARKRKAAQAILNAEPKKQPEMVNFDFIGLKKEEPKDLTAVTQLIGAQDVQLRRLDLADKELQVDFREQPEISVCFDNFASQLLPMPSKAETLVDLQAEFNSLKLTSDDPDQTRITDDVQQINPAWNLQKYYT
jgi:hypothetical protein